MAKYLITIPDEVVLECDDNIEVMDRIAEALRDEFDAKQITVKDLD